jgi:hypothetical protein
MAQAQNVTRSGNRNGKTPAKGAKMTQAQTLTELGNMLAELTKKVEALSLKGTRAQVGNSVAPVAKKAASTKKASSLSVKKVRRLVKNPIITKISSASLKRGYVFRIVPDGADYTAIAVSTPPSNWKGSTMVKVDHPTVLAKDPKGVIKVPATLYRVNVRQPKAC